MPTQILDPRQGSSGHHLGLVLPPVQGKQIRVSLGKWTSPPVLPLSGAAGQLTRVILEAQDLQGVSAKPCEDVKGTFHFILVYSGHGG